jgi:hypothetical protein
VPAGSIFGYELTSEVPLVRLAPAPGPRGSLRVVRGRPPAAEGEVVHRLELQDAAFTLTRVASGLHVACSLTGTYLVDAYSGLVEVAPEGPGDVWEHRLLSTVLPLLLAERGDLVVHGSAVDAGGRAVIFLGTSGRGKSTLALAAGSRGFPVLAEDGAVVADGLVWPGPLGVRVAADVRQALGGEDASDGRAVVPVSRAAAPVELAALVILGERGAALTIKRLAPAAAVPALVPNLIFGGSDRLSQAFSLAVRAAARVPVYRCSLADDLGRASQQAAEVLSAVAG